MSTDRIIILATGGTFDKVYYDALTGYKIGPPQALNILEQAGVGFDYAVETLIQKDSLDMTDDDRRQISKWVADDKNKLFVITHGTDTMVETARALERKLAPPIGKTVVLTGAMQPARFKNTDADFNLGFALGAVQALPPGVYIAMNGAILKPGETVKNRDAGRFERE